MVQLTTTETDLVDQLLDILEEAIASVPSVDPAYANKTKIQKLLFLAIDEFDIPITYSWYLAGAVVPDRSIGPDSLTGPTGPSAPSPPSPAETADTAEAPDIAESVEPADDRAESAAGSAPASTAESEPKSADMAAPADSSSEIESIDPVMFTGDTTLGDSSRDSRDLTAYVDREDLLDFYRDAIPEVWHERTMRFLQNFYQEMAPAEYRLLYIESTHLRTHLTDLIDAIRAHLDGETPAREISALRDSIELSISDLHYYLRQHDRLRQTFNVVVDGTDLIEDALLMLDHLDPADLTMDHLELLQALQDFFYYYVWKYPCLLISQQTATGPCAADLRSERAAEFDSFDRTVLARRDDLDSRLAAAGLRPGPDDYPPVEDQAVAETLSDLSSEYLE